MLVNWVAHNVQRCHKNMLHHELKPVDSVETAQLQELVLHDIYFGECFWAGSPSVDAARRVKNPADVR